MPASRLPAFQFYPGDWRKDPGVQALSYHDRGVWFEILCLMHESDQRGRLILNGKPMPDQAIARLLGIPENDLEKTLETLIDFGVAERDRNGCLINRRMIRDEKLRKIRSESGKKGGNPALVAPPQIKDESILLNQNPTTPLKQIPTPSSSSSSSSSCLNTESLKELNLVGSAAENAADTEPEKPTQKRKVGSRIPDTFNLTAEMREWAATERPDIDPFYETKRFVNHFRSKTGKDATKLNWNLTWQNWILGARVIHGVNTNGTQQKPTSEREKSAQRRSNGNLIADQLEQQARDEIARRDAIPVSNHQNPEQDY